MALVLSVLLLIPALTGFARLRPHQLPANLLWLYWLPSWLGQSLAAPYAIAALALGAFAEGPARIVALFSMGLFVLIHLRNRRDGVALMRGAGSAEQLPILAGLWPISSRAGTERSSAYSYADDGERTTLDVVRPLNPSTTPMPVLIHIHGGAWVLGKRNQQAKPLLHHLARHGWLCLDINYRLAPKHKFPAMLSDIHRAIAWVRAHAGEFGGDPDRIVLTGGSAGGHLTALGALSSTGFGVQAAVPMYGRFDFIDRANLLGRNREAIRKFEAGKVMPADADEALWDLASPIAQVRGDAPPMLVIHGRHDTLLPNEEAAAFVAAQRGTGGHVDYIELSGGQHAFDIFQSAATAGHVRAVRHWLSTKGLTGHG